MKTRLMGLAALTCVTLVTLVLVSVVARGATQTHDRRPGEQLVVRNIVAGQDITSHEWGMVRLEVGIERKGAPNSGKRAKARRSPLKIKVDNKEVDCYVVSSSTGYEGKKTYAYKTVAIRLGPQPGPKVITVLNDGLTKSIPVNYNPSGQLEFTNLYDRQAVFGKKPVIISWFGCYLAKESVKISINGEALPSATMENPPEAPELLAGRISATERLNQGSNKIKIEALDVKGAKFEKELVMQYYPENRVPIGDEFAVSLGMEDPKSGPYHDVTVEGASLVKTGETGIRPGPERMGGQTVVPPGKVVLAWFKAVGPGETAIATKVKQYATDDPKEVERARVAVYYSATAGLSEAENALGLQKYVVKNLFTCGIPGEWVKAENPDGENNVVGVSAYEKSPQDMPAARVSIAFYSPDSAAGKTGAQAYIDALMKEVQPEKRSDDPALINWILKAYDEVEKRVWEAVEKWQPEQSVPPVMKLMEATIAGRQARVVERNAFFVKSKMIVFKSRIPVAERFVVIPADAGFYVLSFSTPASDAEKNRELFATIAGSFRPLK